MQSSTIILLNAGSDADVYNPAAQNQKRHLANMRGRLLVSRRDPVFGLREHCSCRQM